jgi:hypothetical protein
MRSVIPVTVNSLFVFPVLDLYSFCACVPSVVICHLYESYIFFGRQDKFGLWALQFV